MPKLIQRIEHADSREVEYLYDDGTRVIEDTRTGGWAVFRIPSINDILDAANGSAIAQGYIAGVAKPIRYTPPQLADAPRHTADVMDESDD